VAPKLYSSLAGWWPLLSPPVEYAEEASIYGRYLLEYGDRPARTLVEFGSGGGSNAFYLKRQFQVTLVDLAPGMLEVSRKLNPECEHIHGDMRGARLGREFDRVFIHDAICYMTTLADLRRAIDTAFAHCRPGGAALLVPDYVRETFRPSTSHGGADGNGRGLRYLEWVWDPDPSDATYFADYAYLLREADGTVRAERDRHVEGLFSRAEWLETIAGAGFEPQALPFEHSETEPMELFLGIRPRR
jgi:SAM-dependent methyltransferase